MKESIKSFIESVAKRNANEPEFMQAVQEVAETVIPFIEDLPIKLSSSSLPRSLWTFIFIS